MLFFHLGFHFLNNTGEIIQHQTVK